MPAYIGDTAIGGVYIGDTAASKVYLGDTELWSGAPSVPTFDAAGAGGNNTAKSAAAVTSTHTAVGGADCVVVLGVTYGSLTAGTTTLPTVTYGGTPMTHLSGTLLEGSNVGWLRFFYLFNPPAGLQTVSTTPPASAITSHLPVSYVGVGSIGTATIVARGATVTTKTVTVPSVASTDLAVAMFGVATASRSFTSTDRTQRGIRNANSSSTDYSLLVSDTGSAGDATGSVAISGTMNGSSINVAAIGVRLIA